mmetsp:Transcript_15913/g.37527  ORF Transcript_15913/g.37527 Transcript_15913/m.37527 type:complete len:1128 (-) Transcript_15913:63-3446(-)
MSRVLGSTVWLQALLAAAGVVGMVEGSTRTCFNVWEPMDNYKVPAPQALCFEGVELKDEFLAARGALCIENTPDEMHVYLVMQMTGCRMVIGLNKHDSRYVVSSLPAAEGQQVEPTLFGSGSSFALQCIAEGRIAAEGRAVGGDDTWAHAAMSQLIRQYLLPGFEDIIVSKTGYCPHDDVSDIAAGDSQRAHEEKLPTFCMEPAKKQKGEGEKFYPSTLADFGSPFPCNSPGLLNDAEFVIRGAVQDGETDPTIIELIPDLGTPSAAMQQLLDRVQQQLPLVDAATLCSAQDSGAAAGADRDNLVHWQCRPAELVSSLLRDAATAQAPASILPPERDNPKLRGTVSGGRHNVMGSPPEHSRGGELTVGRHLWSPSLSEQCTCPVAPTFELSCLAGPVFVPSFANPTSALDLEGAEVLQEREELLAQDSRHRHRLMLEGVDALEPEWQELIRSVWGEREPLPENTAECSVVERILARGLPELRSLQFGTVKTMHDNVECAEQFRQMWEDFHTEVDYAIAKLSSIISTLRAVSVVPQIAAATSKAAEILESFRQVLQALDAKMHPIYEGSDSLNERVKVSLQQAQSISCITSQVLSDLRSLIAEVALPAVLMDPALSFCSGGSCVSEVCTAVTDPLGALLEDLVPELDGAFQTAAANLAEVRDMYGSVCGILKSVQWEQFFDFVASVEGILAPILAALDLDVCASVDFPAICQREECVYVPLRCPREKRCRSCSWGRCWSYPCGVEWYDCSRTDCGQVPYPCFKPLSACLSVRDIVLGNLGGISFPALVGRLRELAFAKLNPLLGSFPTDLFNLITPEVPEVPDLAKLEVNLFDFSADLLPKLEAVDLAWQVPGFAHVAEAALPLRSFIADSIRDGGKEIRVWTTVSSSTTSTTTASSWSTATSSSTATTSSTLTSSSTATSSTSTSSSTATSSSTSTSAASSSTTSTVTIDAVGIMGPSAGPSAGPSSGPRSQHGSSAGLQLSEVDVMVVPPSLGPSSERHISPPNGMTEPSTGPSTGPSSGPPSMGPTSSSSTTSSSSGALPATTTQTTAPTTAMETAATTTTTTTEVTTTNPDQSGQGTCPQAAAIVEDYHAQIEAMIMSLQGLQHSLNRTLVEAFCPSVCPCSSR